jgi:hypothetical protein
MNILELQLRVVISGVPGNGSDPPLDWSVPRFELLSTVPPDLSPPSDRREPDPGWPELTYHQL